MSNITATIVSEEEFPMNNEGNIIPGGMNAMKWKDYLKCFPKEMRPEIMAIRKCLIKSEHYKTTADNFCNDYYFQLSSGNQIGFTWRAWGDLNSAIANKMEGYMKYYM